MAAAGSTLLMVAPGGRELYPCSGNKWLAVLWIIVIAIYFVLMSGRCDYRSPSQRTAGAACR